MQKEWTKKQNGQDLNTKSAKAFGGTFVFFSTHKPMLKNPKEPPSQRTKKAVNNGQHSNDRQKASL